MKKYIFLDIDGVLAVPDPKDGGAWNISPVHQDRLGKIISETGAEIVLSSSWRHNDLPRTILHMDEHGFRFSDKMIGITIRAYQHIIKGVHLSIPRGVEIAQWIDTNVHSDNGKDWDRKQIGSDFTYVILDDDSDMLLCQKDHFIKTESVIGLTDEHVARAIEILNHTPQD